MGAASPVWTDERVEQMKALRSQGLSTSKIAARLGGGLSRNAVISKLSRLGVVFNPSPAKTRPAPRAPIVRSNVLSDTAFARGKARKAVKRPLENVPDINPVPGAFPPRPKNVPDVSGTTITARKWTDRESGECAYPVFKRDGETYSCCAPTNERPYCDAHHRRMYTPGSAFRGRPPRGAYAGTVAA